MCEQAVALIGDTLRAGTYHLEIVDIAEQSEAVYQRYALTIPVLACGERELGWPFSGEDLAGFLAAEESI